MSAAGVCATHVGQDSACESRRETCRYLVVHVYSARFVTAAGVYYKGHSISTASAGPLLGPVQAPEPFRSLRRVVQQSAVQLDPSCGVLA